MFLSTEVLVTPRIIFEKADISKLPQCVLYQFSAPCVLQHLSFDVNDIYTNILTPASPREYLIILGYQSSSTSLLGVHVSGIEDGAVGDGLSG